MNIASHTFPIDKIAIRFSVFQFIQWRNRRTRYKLSLSHVNFVSPANCFIIPEMESHPASYLLTLHGSYHGKQSQTRQLTDISLYSIGIADFHSHHLVSATNPHDRSPFAMCTQDSLRHTITAKFI